MVQRLAVVLLALGIAACGVRVNPGLESAEALVDSVLRSGLENAGSDSYDLLARDARAQLSEDDWIQCWTSINSSVSDVDYFLGPVNPVPATDDAFVTATFEYLDVSGDPWTLQIQLLAREESEGRWLFLSMWLTGAEVHVCSNDLFGSAA